ncbi:MAG: DUF402 domain-containing protein [Thermomicrobiales bacterium]
MTASDRPDHCRLAGTSNPGVLWRPDTPTLALWDDLRPGRAVTIVKQGFSGAETARYPGTVIGDAGDDPWRTVVAHWTMKDVTEGGLTFATGDTLHERFSPRHPFNAFAVTDVAGAFKGWYANVTWPALLRRERDQLILTWRDLILDVVILPDGTVTCLDEDEFELAQSQFGSAGFADEVREIRDRIIALAKSGSPPLHQLP